MDNLYDNAQIDVIIIIKTKTTTHLLKQKNGKKVTKKQILK